jgi:hypothetical protein
MTAPAVDAAGSDGLRPAAADRGGNALAAGAEPFLPAAVDRAEGSPPRGNEFGAAAEERRSGRHATLRDDLDPAA